MVAEVLESSIVELHVVFVMLEKLYLPVGENHNKQNGKLVNTILTSSHLAFDTFVYKLLMQTTPVVGRLGWQEIVSL